MTMPKVDVIDYGMGNLWSVIGALEHLGYEAKIINTPEAILNSELLILPGVGSFRRAMESLNKRHLDEAIKTAISSGSTRILGICLGMQLLCSRSSEDGVTPGLGFLPYEVDLFVGTEGKLLKVPHVGFSEVSAPFGSRLFSGIKDQSHFYFVHSYKIPFNPVSEVLESTCYHGSTFVAAFEKDNIFGTQFHPEKSQANGLKLLENFLSI